MPTNTPNDDDESPPNLPPFITPPLPRPRTRIPEVMQTQSPNHKARIDKTANINSEEDACLQFHDPELVPQTPVRPLRLTPVLAAPIVHSPLRCRIVERM